jgi:hypothetical protein
MKNESAKGRLAMNAFRPALLCAAALALAAPAQAGPLKIVEVGAPAVNCVFDKSCQLLVTDSLGAIHLAGDVGIGRMQTRTYTGAAGAPGAGKTVYQYRVDLKDVLTDTAQNCIGALKIDFGPVATLPYSGPAQVFVVTTGGLGSVGLASATLTGGVVTFKFAAPICPEKSSFFFGLSSADAPAPSTAQLFSMQSGPMLSPPVRAPAH